MAPQQRAKTTGPKEKISKWSIVDLRQMVDPSFNMRETHPEPGKEICQGRRGVAK